MAVRRRYDCAVEAGLIFRGPCGKPTIYRCANCGKPVCFKHGIKFLWQWHCNRIVGEVCSEDCLKGLYANEASLLAYWGESQARLNEWGGMQAYFDHTDIFPAYVNKTKVDESLAKKYRSLASTKGLDDFRQFLSTVGLG